jgi:uncharacterized protein YutE (UPF0331/DUF86 family)
MHNLLDYMELTERTPAEFASKWGMSVSIGAGVRNVYNGMEDIMKSIAKDIDGYVPGGEVWHQDLLDQMAAESSERDPLLDAELYDGMCALKSFRHVVNHNYGAALKLEKVYENLDILKGCYDRFIETVRNLEASFSDDDEPTEEDWSF